MTFKRSSAGYRALVSIKYFSIYKHGFILRGTLAVAVSQSAALP